MIATAQETGQDEAVILTLVPELRDFAGHYLERGAFLVAESESDTDSEADAAAGAGAVGITPGVDGSCQMNRLWIRPAFRRGGLGRDLCVAALATARQIGFRRMTLDVLPERTNAIALYRSLGFVGTPPAHEYPFPMVSLGREL